MQRQAAAGIAVLDIEMPSRDGFEVAQNIRENRLPIEIVFLTLHKDEHYFYKALELNVEGYLLKESAVTDIIDCLKTVAEDRVFISQAISEMFSEIACKTEPAQNANLCLIETMSSTERRIVSLRQLEPPT